MIGMPACVSKYSCTDWHVCMWQTTASPIANVHALEYQSTHMPAGMQQGIQWRNILPDPALISRRYDNIKDCMRWVRGGLTKDERNQPTIEIPKVPGQLLNIIIQHQAWPS